MGSAARRWYTPVSRAATCGCGVGVRDWLLFATPPLTATISVECLFRSRALGTNTVVCRK